MPVGYEVYKEEDHYRFEWVMDSKSNLIVPPIRVYHSKEGIDAKGVHDADIIHQLTKIVGVYPFDHFHQELPSLTKA